ncbi:MAG: hypothetical protein GY696_21350 [Gammaproteobacteria bacterium]|nr:hypothetical protein [Gammaproteobacteria bacterium]
MDNIATQYCLHRPRSINKNGESLPMVGVQSNNGGDTSDWLRMAIPRGDALVDCRPLMT